MNPLLNVPNVQRTPSETAAMTCPTCKQDKQWKGDKPGSPKAPAKAAPKPGSKFRAMAVKRGPGRTRVNPRDNRYVEFF